MTNSDSPLDISKLQQQEHFQRQNDPTQKKTQQAPLSDQEKESRRKHFLSFLKPDVKRYIITNLARYKQIDKINYTCEIMRDKVTFKIGTAVKKTYCYTYKTGQTTMNQQPCNEIEMFDYLQRMDKDIANKKVECFEEILTKIEQDNLTDEEKT